MLDYELGNVLGSMTICPEQLTQDNVWYCRLKLFFTMMVKIDSHCSYISFCFEIKLEPSGMQKYYAVIGNDR